MQYRFGTGMRALMDLSARHERWDLLNEEALDCALNVYYRRWMILEDGGQSFDLFSSNMAKNMNLTARFRSESAHIDQYIDILLDFGKSANSTVKKAVFEKMQSDFVDTFKYGIENPQKKWGWQRNRERKGAEIYDINNLMKKISADSNRLPKEEVEREIDLWKAT